MATTPNLSLTLLEASQSQKEVTVNEALFRIDSVLNNGVIDRDLNTPPVSPAEGATYIVAASPTGAWAGKANQIAYFQQIWRFIVPKAGLSVWVIDESKHYLFNGTNWQAMPIADMFKATYDTANIAQQVVGTSATQTLTGKTINLANNTLTATSAQLATAVTDKTGNGALVFADTPSLVTPNIGAATATTVNKVSITAPATSAALTIADGKTFTASNSLTLAGTDATTMTFPATSGTVATLNNANIFTQAQTVTTAASSLTVNRTDGNPGLINLQTTASLRGQIGADATYSIRLHDSSGTLRWGMLETGGAWRPAGNNTQDIGTTGARIANVHTNGINFGNSANASTTTLDWYEEGTFTPTIVGSTTAGSGTYNTQTGRYTRIGRLVYVQIALVWSAHTGTGNMRIGGLPFAAAAIDQPIAIAYYSTLNLGAGKQPGALVLASGTQIALYVCDPADVAASTLAMDSAVAYLALTGAYIV